MKISSTVSFILAFGLFAQNAALADTKLTVVHNFSKAEAKEIWSKVKIDAVPEALLSTATIETPIFAFKAPKENLFFQDLNLFLCLNACEEEQNITLDGSGGDYSVLLQPSKWYNKGKVRKENGSVIRQNTVYYWVGKMFQKLAGLGFSPKTNLKVLVDREINELTERGNAENNAFYNPLDNTLSFLPAGNSLFSKLLAGKLRPSGYDPTVAVHEAGHFVFNELTGGRNVNDEIGGLNEGFADYLAMIVLDTGKIGTVMLSGKPLRDATKLLTYGRGMEVHDLGNVFSSALWLTRTETKEADLFDRAVLDAVKTIGQNIYATAFDFIKALNESLIRLGASRETRDLAFKNFKSAGLTGEYTTLSEEQLLAKRNGKKFLNLALTTKIPGPLARSYGLDPVTNVSLDLIEKREMPSTSDGKSYEIIYLSYAEQDVVTPFILYRESTSDNLLAAYHIDGTLVSEDKGFKLLQKVLENYSNAEKFQNIKEAKELVEVVAGSKWMVKLKVKDESIIRLNVNGELIDVKKTSGKVKLKFLGRLASLITSVPKEMDHFVSFTTTDKRFEGRLPKLGNEYILGHETILKNGVSERVLVEAVGLE